MTSPNTKKSEEEKPLQFSNPQLMQALYWVWDAFERSNMGMFLVYKTAEDVLQNIDIEDNKITVGTRDNEWRSGSTSILKSFMGDPLEETDKFALFKNPFNQVPVYVYIFKDDPSITSPNQVFYKAEYFMLPNPYSKFIEVFGAKS